MKDEEELLCEGLEKRGGAKEEKEKEKRAGGMKQTVPNYIIHHTYLLHTFYINYTKRI